MVISNQKKFSDLVETMRVLRSDSGCEWDRAQTHDSLKPYLIEEAYEVLDAIDSGEDHMLVEELGDLLLQILFHAQIASERGAFDFDTIIENLNKKLIRRHPHVFDGAAGYSYMQWEKIKAREKGSEARSPIGRLNSALPALSLARRVTENAQETGMEKLDQTELIRDIEYAVTRVKESAEAGNNETTDEDLGKLLLSVARFAVLQGLDPERGLRRTVRGFVNRLEDASRHKEES